MSFFDAEKSGSLTSNTISWRGDSALSDALNGASLAGGFYDGGNGRHTSSHTQTKSKVFAFWRHNGGLWMHNQKQPDAKHILSNLGFCREPKKRASHAEHNKSMPLGGFSIGALNILSGSMAFIPA